MTFFLLVPIFSLGKADEQIIQELFLIKQKVRIFPPQKSEVVLINFQETYEKANGIKDGIDCLII